MPPSSIPPQTVARPDVAAAKRVVVKLGTRVLTHSDGRLALARLFAVVEAVRRLVDGGKETLVVSSGAVGLGREALRLDHVPSELAERQACAAVGQTRLMALYEAGFSQLGLHTAQVLLTEGDFDDRVRYLNLRNTLLTLLKRQVVPVINENDAVSVEELAWADGSEDARPVFGDNDKLSALVATKLDADLLVLLTDVDGLFDRDPHGVEHASLVGRLDPNDEQAARLAGDSASGVGRGGMRSKIEAARIAALSGCHVVIASGIREGTLARVLAGEAEGTWIPAQPGIPARHRWIAWAAAPRGTLHIDDGAVRALRERGASLLAAGVNRVEGHFHAGDVVVLRSVDGRRVGRGIVVCDHEMAKSWCAGERPAFARNHHALVHRDHLVLDPEPTSGTEHHE
jgi:glutamate 5-kinase